MVSGHGILLLLFATNQKFLNVSKKNYFAAVIYQVIYIIGAIYLEENIQLWKNSRIQANTI